MSLTSLPTEIAELITLHLDLPSFSLLRLINSHLNQQSLRSFKDRFFRKRTIQWTEASFRELLDVTDHPTFGDALQNIIIDATPYYGRQIWRMEQILKGNRDEFDDKIEDVSIAKREECWNEANEAAKFWKETELDQKCLTVVFQKLKLVGENRSQESHIESLLFKYERHGSGVFRKYHEICIREMSRPFISIMSAICASGIRIKKILGHEKLRWGAVGIGRLESLAPRLRKFDHAFEHLQVLQLNLRDWRAHEDGFALPEQHIPFIVRFLAKARKLKSLELSCYSVLDKDLFSAMAHTCHYSHLTTCKLDLFSMKDCDLFTFLEPSKSHLKHLTLSQVFLDEKSARHNWPDILRHLVSPSGADLQLEYLRVTGLYSRRAAPLLFHALDESQRSTTLTLRSEDGENGKADLKVELEKACRTTIFSFSPIRSFTAAASLAPRLAFDVYE